jgi:hypothetical protein
MEIINFEVAWISNAKEVQYIWGKLFYDAYKFIHNILVYLSV